MSEFASEDRCYSAIDAIAALIPSEQLRANVEGRVYIRGTLEQGVIIDELMPRVGEERGNWAGKIVLNPRIPISWQANVHEPFHFQSDRPNQPPVQLITQKAEVCDGDKRVSFASFDTYGLDVYDSDQDYQLKWHVIRPASRDGGDLGIFAANPKFIFTPRFCSAMLREGHARYDKPEEQALIAAYSGVQSSKTIAREAHCSSLRLTDAGADYLLKVLDSTKTMQILFNAVPASTAARMS